MTKAEEKSIAYQFATHGPRVMGGGAILSEDDYKFWNINYDFKAGYEQAEKDLALTWEDMKTIVRIADGLMDSAEALIDTEARLGIQPYYEEVLRRFKEAMK